MRIYKQLKQNRGFTLLELMIVLVIMGVMFSMAIPSFKIIMQNSHAAEAVNTFIAQANFARSEAIKRNSRVTMCVSIDQETCNTTANWTLGWIIFNDVDNNGIVGSDEQIIRIHAKQLQGDITLIGNANVVSYLSYVGSGFPQLVGGAFQAGTIKYRDTATYGRDIILAASGRFRVEHFRPI